MTGLSTSFLRSSFCFLHLAQKSYLTGSYFENNDLSYCILSGRQIENTTFSNNNIGGSEWNEFPFKRCTFKHMDFRDTKFENVQFIECKFEDCLYTEEQAGMFGLI